MAVMEGKNGRKGEISRCLPQRVVDPSPYCNNKGGRRRGRRRLWIAADLLYRADALGVPHGKGLGDAAMLDRWEIAQWRSIAREGGGK